MGLSTTNIGAGSNWKGVSSKARASGGDAGTAVAGERGRPATRWGEEEERVSGCEGVGRGEV